MATVAIRMCPELSGTHASVGLAQRLRDRGHRVVYLAAAEVAGTIAAAGMDVELVPGDDLLPAPADLDDVELEGPLADAAFGAEAIARRVDALSQRVGALLRRAGRFGLRRATAAGELRRKLRAADRVVARLRPDVALVDPIIPWATLPFAEHGVPLICANPSLVGPPTLAYPNLLSARPPRPGQPIATAAIALAELRLLRHVLIRHAADWLAWYPLAGFSLARRLRRAGIALEPHDLGIRARLPEVVLMPAAFDYPAARPIGVRRYAGVAIDRSRQAPAFAWSRLRPGAPLAYCAIGTQGTPALRRRVYAAVAEVFRARPAWDVVLGGGGVDAGAGLDLPPNLHVVDRAPQLDLLARARLFVTHAGPASIREAIYFGVPMVALPYGGDQFGLAARVEYHRLGRAGRAWTVDGAQLRALVDAVVGNRAIAAAVRAMQARCRASRELDDAIALIESRGRA